jgi:RNA polymerase sigma-70 factor, ECF subfamily
MDRDVSTADSTNSRPPLQPLGRTSGDTESFLRLYSLHQKHIYAFVGTFFRDAADIDDVLQETSIVLWSKYAELRPGADFLPWAFGVARLEVFRHLRGKRGSGLPFDDSLMELLADERSRQQPYLERRRQALDSCLNKLGRRDHALIDECYQRGVLIKDVAERLCRPVNAVYQSLSRIRRQLHECVSRTMAIGEG